LGSERRVANGGAAKTRDTSEEATMKRITLLAAAAFALIAGSAFAGTRDPGINYRQARQHERIAQGVASGELTARETARLIAEQREIAAEERYYRRDGRLSAWERADLERDLDRASRDIYRQKHDAQTRW
jgi:hypothetical protein